MTAALTRHIRHTRHYYCALRCVWGSGQVCAARNPPGPSSVARGQPQAGRIDQPSRFRESPAGPDAAAAARPISVARSDQMLRRRCRSTAAVTTVMKPLPARRFCGRCRHGGAVTAAGTAVLRPLLSRWRCRRCRRWQWSAAASKANRHAASKGNPSDITAATAAMADGRH